MLLTTVNNVNTTALSHTIQPLSTILFNVELRIICALLTKDFMVDDLCEAGWNGELSNKRSVLVGFLFSVHACLNGVGRSGD